VGGIVGNRKMFGSLLTGVDHLPATYDREKQAFSKGEPDYGAHFADELERIVNLHGANTVAAVIVEPMAGSTGVLPAPKGYLKRLREITQKHGILLIFDEVMSGPEHVVELAHGYTYSAHPLACAAGLATLDIYRDEKLFERANKLEPKFADAVMSLRNEPGVVDIRTVGLTAGIDLASVADAPGKRGFAGLDSAFHDNDLMLRVAGDTLVLTPPLIITEDQIGEIVEKVAKVIRATA
jgi:beta-alanine--pyruvate transaminase